MRTLAAYLLILLMIFFLDVGAATTLAMQAVSPGQFVYLADAEPSGGRLLSTAAGVVTQVSGSQFWLATGVGKDGKQIVQAFSRTNPNTLVVFSTPFHHGMQIAVAGTYKQPAGGGPREFTIAGTKDPRGTMHFTVAKTSTGPEVRFQNGGFDFSSSGIPQSFTLDAVGSTPQTMQKATDARGERVREQIAWAQTQAAWRQQSVLHTAPVTCPPQKNAATRFLQWIVQDLLWL